MSLESLKTVSSALTVDKKRVRVYKTVYQAIVSSKEEGPRQVLAYSGMPSIYSGYLYENEVDSAARCTSISVDKKDPNGRAWLIACEFRTDAIEEAENPLERAPKYRLEFTQHTKVVERDINLALVVNTVGDKFTDPPLTQDESRPTLVIVRNEAELDFGFALDYKDAINSDNFKGAAPGQVKLVELSHSDLQVENDVEFYTKTYKFQGNPDGWNPQVLNVGMYAKDSAGKRYKIAGIKKPVKLKEDGTILPEGEEPFYIPFETHKLRSFNALGL